MAKRLLLLLMLATVVAGFPIPAEASVPYNVQALNTTEPSRVLYVGSSISPRVVLYFHQGGGNLTSFGDPEWDPTRDALLNAGYSIAESQACGNNWGNNCGRAAYRQVVVALNPQKLYLLGRSMGGLTAAYAAVEDSWIAPKVKAVAFSSAVLDRQAFEDADTANHWPEVHTTAGYDPMLAPPIRWSHRLVRNYYGSADTVCPPSQHALAFQNRFGGSAVNLGPYEHKQTFGIADDLVAFFNSAG